MKKTLLLKAEVRQNVGSKAAAKVRTVGKIPATVYGHGEKPLSITLNAHDVAEGLHHGSRVVEVQVGSKKATMLFKDLQYDYLGKNIIHADLIRVDAAEMVKVSVPIEAKGTAQGTHEGGIVEEHVDSLEIECRVTDIPETIAVSVKELTVGNNIHAGEVELPEGMKLISDPNLLLFTCHLVAAAKSTEEMEEEIPVTPEVIGQPEQEPEAAKEAAKEAKE